MLVWIAVIVFSVYIDQLTKWLAVIYLEGRPSFQIIKGVIQLTYAENKGAAFSMLQNHRWLFISVSAIAIIVMLVYLFKFRPKSKLICLGISMLIGGGTGNMIDRVMQGYVVDFIDFNLINFAVFNGADSFICVGAGLIILSVIISSVKDIKDAKKDKVNDRE